MQHGSKSNPCKCVFSKMLTCVANPHYIYNNSEWPRRKDLRLLSWQTKFDFWPDQQLLFSVTLCLQSLHFRAWRGVREKRRKNVLLASFFKNIAERLMKLYNCLLFYCRIREYARMPNGCKCWIQANAFTQMRIWETSGCKNRAKYWTNAIQQILQFAILILKSQHIHWRNQ